LSTPGSPPLHTRGDAWCLRERGTAPPDARDAAAGPRRPHALGSRSRSAPASTPRTARDHRPARLATPASNGLIGSSLAVPQRTRDRPQPSEAACHHSSSAHILNTSQVLASSAIAGEHRLGQREQRFDPRAPIIRRARAGLPLLANGGRPTLHELPRSVPLLAEETNRRRKRIGDDRLFQSGPGKAIDRLQPRSCRR
jgi:hypothetical protein